MNIIKLSKIWKTVSRPLSLQKLLSSAVETGHTNETDCLAHGCTISSHISGYSFLVVHPRIRWTAEPPTVVKIADHQLEEAVSLVQTIPNFKVIRTVIVGTDYNTRKMRLWGAGRLHSLLEIKDEIRATAMMINVDMLTPNQQTELFNVFGVPIFDRYNIILLIFKLYAKSKITKLQIELAEIPYVRYRLKCVDEEKMVPSVLHISYPRQTKNDKFEALRLREHDLRKRIREVVAENISNVEEKRSRDSTTKIAVVGYTNAGKSSLIKKLTGANEIVVEDRVFVTLDATSHYCRFPSGSQAVFFDTIGFISSLPTQLFASFQTSLKLVATSDIIVHVEDVSHPERLSQRETVMKTLHALSIPESLINSVIHVGNKIDRLPSPPHKDCLHLISCSTGQGINDLITLLDQRVMSLRGSLVRLLRLRPGSNALAYLYRNSLLLDVPTPSECGNFLLCRAVMDEDQLNIFKANFLVKNQKNFEAQ